MTKHLRSSKLEFVNGWDPYEIPRSEWKDDTGLWPVATHVHVCMYLILTPSLSVKLQNPWLQVHIVHISGDWYIDSLHTGLCDLYRQKVVTKNSLLVTVMVSTRVLHS